mgnify:CR=1 FL=1
MITIGIDPAQSGAACIFREEEVKTVISWRSRTRKKQKVYELTITEARLDGLVGSPYSFIVGSAQEIGSEIACAALRLCIGEDINFSVCCEDAYFGKSAKTSIIVARFAGLITGACCATITAGKKKPTHLQWIKAASWRNALFKLSHWANREQAKKASLSYIPQLAPTIKKHLQQQGDLDHITDAAGVALWAIKNNNGAK